MEKAVETLHLFSMKVRELCASKPDECEMNYFLTLNKESYYEYCPVFINVHLFAICMTAICMFEDILTAKKIKTLRPDQTRHKCQANHK